MNKLSAQNKKTKRDQGHDQRMAAAVAALVAVQFGINALDIIGTTSRGNPTAAKARLVAMYICHTSLKWSQEHTASVFGRDRTSATKAASKIELMRENDSFDDLMTRLEGAAAYLRDVQPIIRKAAA